MTCFNDGKPSTQQRPARFKVNATVASGALALDWTVPCEVVMEQIMVHWSTAPVTSQALVLKRDAIEGAVYDTVYESIDPGLSGWTDWTCIVPFRFAKGDHILVNYTNTDNRTIGLTLFLVQVDN